MPARFSNVIEKRLQDMMSLQITRKDDYNYIITYKYKWVSGMFALWFPEEYPEVAVMVPMTSIHSDASKGLEVAIASALVAEAEFDRVPIENLQIVSNDVVGDDARKIVVRLGFRENKAKGIFILHLFWHTRGRVANIALDVIEKYREGIQAGLLRPDPSSIQKRKDVMSMVHDITSGTGRRATTPAASITSNNNNNMNTLTTWVSGIIMGLIGLFAARKLVKKIRPKFGKLLHKLQQTESAYKKNHWLLIHHCALLSRGKQRSYLRSRNVTDMGLSQDELMELLVFSLEKRWMDVVEQVVREQPIRARILKDNVLMESIHSIPSDKIRRKILKSLDIKTQPLGKQSQHQIQRQISQGKQQQQTLPRPFKDHPQIQERLQQLDPHVLEQIMTKIPNIPFSPQAEVQGISQILSRHGNYVVTFHNDLRNLLFRMFPNLIDLQESHIIPIEHYVKTKLRREYGNTINKNAIEQVLTNPDFLSKLYKHIVNCLLFDDTSEFVVEEDDLTPTNVVVLQQQQQAHNLHELYNQQRRNQRQQQRQIKLAQEQQVGGQQETAPTLLTGQQVKIPITSRNVERLPKKQTQDMRFRNVIAANIRKIGNIMRKKDVAQTIMSKALQTGAANIYIVDGPNLTYKKKQTFAEREKLIAGGSFRDWLSKKYSASSSAKSIFLIVSQKNWTEDSKELVVFHDKPRANEKGDLFFYARVGCYNFTTHRNCISQFGSNECDDFVRHDVIDQLQKMRAFFHDHAGQTLVIKSIDGKKVLFRGAPTSFPCISEKTNDKGVNWKY